MAWLGPLGLDCGLERTLFVRRTSSQVGFSRAAGTGVSSNGFENCRGTLASERQHACGHLITKPSRMRTNPFAGRVLRLALVPGTYKQTFPRCCRESLDGLGLLLVSRAHPSSRHAFVQVNLGRTEVQNFSPATFHDENVGGFDVAMDDALGVCSMEPFATSRRVPISTARPAIRCFSVIPSRNSITMNACPFASPMS